MPKNQMPNQTPDQIPDRTPERMPDWEKFLRDRLELPRMQERRDDRMIRELADHLEDRYREARLEGASPEQAEAAAMESLGDLQLANGDLVAAEPARLAALGTRWARSQEDRARGRGGAWTRIADFARDLRLSVRVLARRRLFSLAVVLVLAVGIGGTSAMFTLVDSVLLSPLPFNDQDRLLSVSHTAPKIGFDDAGQCAAWHYTYEADSRTLERLGMYEVGSVAVTGAGDPEAVAALFVTSGVLDTLALVPELGRTVLLTDEGPQAAPVVLLTSHYWRTRFGGDRAVIGRLLEVDGTRHEIVGVVPDDIAALGERPDLILPLRADKSALYVGNIGYGAVARLRAGVTLNQVAEELQRLLPSAWERYPGGPIATAEDVRAFSVVVVPLKQRLVGESASLLWVLLAGVGLVLLVACANAANLFLVRTADKRTEMALRRAIGASALRVRWEYIKESLILSLAAGLLGMALAALGLKALVAVAPVQLPRIQEVSLSPLVLLTTFAISLVAGLAIGLLPALRAGRLGAGEALVGGCSRGALKGSSQRFQSTVAIAQVALILVLLIASGLMFRSFQKLGQVEPGFGKPENVQTLRLYIPPDEVPEIEDAALVFETIARRLEQVPGVDGVALATAIPMDGNNNVNAFYAESSSKEGAGRGVIKRHKWVGGEFFSVMQIPIVAGREIEWQDVQNRLPTAVVSASLAREYWGSPEAAIGQRIAARPEPPFWYQVVGVAGDVRDDGISQEALSMVYWPQVARGFWNGTSADSILAWRDNGFAIRSNRVGDSRFLGELERAIWEINPQLPLLQSATLPELMARSIASTSFLTQLLAVASGLALLLGLAGVYGLVSNSVSQQSQELGIRMAFGASARDIQVLVLRQGLVILVAGVLLGLGLTLGLRNAMGHLLFGVSPSDPVTVAMASVSLALVVLAACYFPARRAAAVDPMDVVRAN